MKLNWKSIKIIVMVLVAVGAVVWAIDTIRPRSYSGTNLTFSVNDGPVSVTNPSNQAVLVELIDSGPRTFSISSTIEGVSGSSTRDRVQNTRTHSIEFELPPGTSEFTITDGSDVTFVADTDIQLQATVSPVNQSSRRRTLIIAGVVVLGALFFASRLNRHRWTNGLRRYPPSTQGKSTHNVKRTTFLEENRQVRTTRLDNDNRTNTGD